MKPFIAVSVLTIGMLTLGIPIFQALNTPPQLTPSPNDIGLIIQSQTESIDPVEATDLDAIDELIDYYNTDGLIPEDLDISVIKGLYLLDNN
jgi:hypothetical protein